MSMAQPRIAAHHMGSEDRGCRADMKRHDAPCPKAVDHGSPAEDHTLAISAHSRVLCIGVCVRVEQSRVSFHRGHIATASGTCMCNPKTNTISTAAHLPNRRTIVGQSSEDEGNNLAHMIGAIDWRDATP